jgi:hypothetical protein
MLRHIKLRKAKGDYLIKLKLYGRHPSIFQPALVNRNMSTFMDSMKKINTNIKKRRKSLTKKEKDDF